MLASTGAMTALDLSNYGGLLAIGLLTMNVLLGLLVSVRYTPVRRWPYRRINLFRIHNWTGYAALIVSMLHPVALLFSASAGFNLVDILWPLGGNKQPVINTLGALSLYLLACVVLTSVLWTEKTISRRVWKRFHFVSYAMMPLYSVHALLTDPALKDRPLDPLDAEKVFVELCIAAVLLGIALRIRWQRQRSTSSDRIPAGLVLVVFGVSVAAPSAMPAQDLSSRSAARGWAYEPNVGPVYRRGDFRFATWGFAERYWGPRSTTVSADFWRRVRQGMELDLPSIRALRPIVFYEIDLTDNNFFRSGSVTQVFENAYVALQSADDPSNWRVLLGENTHVLSRDDNQSSSNLPTINRSLILEDHGSVNSFGTQWGVQAMRALTPRIALAVSVQDGRGSLNTSQPRYRVGNSLAAKVTAVLRDDSTHRHQLIAGFGADHTGQISNRMFTLVSAIGMEALGDVAAAGDKTSIEGDVEYRTVIARHGLRVDAEALASRFTLTSASVVGGYGLVQFSVFDTPSSGTLDPFLRYDVVSLRGSAPTGMRGSVIHHAIRTGLNYSLPRGHKFVGVHLEYALNTVGGAAQVIRAGPRALSEFRFGLRANTARYDRR